MGTNRLTLFAVLLSLVAFALAAWSVVATSQINDLEVRVDEAEADASAAQADLNAFVGLLDDDMSTIASMMQQLENEVARVQDQIDELDGYSSVIGQQCSRRGFGLGAGAEESICTLAERLDGLAATVSSEELGEEVSNVALEVDALERCVNSIVDALVFNNDFLVGC